MMPKKLWWVIIFLSLAVNVVMLQWTVEAYYGLEYELVFTFTIVALISVVIAFLSYLGWRKQEYSK
ncbi:hypothetical protein [Ammoniphilus sp. CFH 90114]|uniref:hypothetical protein n=1 Tax=Ammoniphilus sp. CFH 90114 TaxID=2493665 RepID=UPI00100F9134|nr:hypothetical protein [Ammoniphilus sp. CFH 90114]RXT05798.1 hypothetical protein EIZ39_16980 [Ammoniphilus sp. CFH 90114]